MLEAHHRGPPAGNGRIKYADPKSLPSYPSIGLRRDDSAAAAASLGWANQKKPSSEMSKPEKANPSTVSSPASAAALLAAEPKSAASMTAADSSGPSTSANTTTDNSAGARAAMLAVTNRSSRSSTHGTLGNNAANLAFRSSQKPSPRESGHGTPTATGNGTGTGTSGRGSLAAAQGALQSSRPRSFSSPTMKPDAGGASSSAAAASALSAATLANKASTSSMKKPDDAHALGAAAHAHKPSLTTGRKSMEDPGSVPTTTLPRSMFTSNPTMGPEAGDQKKADELHNSAVTMARKIFIQQQEAGSDKESAEPQKSPVNLQEAAFKLAQERLAKLEQEHQKNRGYQEYYGGSSNDPVRRVSMRHKLRRRASSDSEVHDRVQSKHRSSFSSRPSQVDDKKRQQDRNALLAAAQRNVKAQLEGMDRDMGNAPAKPHQSKASEWELRAHKAAQEKSEARNVNKGKRDVGGGMFMPQADIDAIASKRMQPVLDDINQKAEKERERLAAQKAKEEAEKLEAEKQKAHELEIKENHRKLKEQQKNLERERKQKEREDEKQRREQEKEEERQRKEDEKAKKRGEKAAKAEQKKLAKEEAKKAKDLEAARRREDKQRRRSNASSSSSSSAEDRDERRPPEHRRPGTSFSFSSEHSAERRASHASYGAADDEPTSPRGEKVKTWLRRKLSRKEKPKPGATAVEDNNGKDDGKVQRRKSILGGLAFGKRPATGTSAAPAPAATNSSTSLDDSSIQQDSIREVAMAGKEPGSGDKGEAQVASPRHEDSGFHEGVGGASSSRPSELAQRDSVSSMSSDASFADATAGRAALTVTPPAPIRDPIGTVSKSASPSRDSRFKEMVD